MSSVINAEPGRLSLMRNMEIGEKMMRDFQKNPYGSASRPFRRNPKTGEYEPEPMDGSPINYGPPPRGIDVNTGRPLMTREQMLERDLERAAGHTFTVKRTPAQQAAVEEEDAKRTRLAQAQYEWRRRNKWRNF